MDDEWRVRLAGWNQPASGKQVSADAVCGLLRTHVGAEVSVSGGKAGIFLYAATADAAAAAAGIAREVFAQQGLAGDIAVERWDRSGQVWLPPGDVAAAELPSGQELGPGRRRLRAAGALIEAIIDASGRGGLSAQAGGGCDAAGQAVIRWLPRFGGCDNLLVRKADIKVAASPPLFSGCRAGYGAPV